MAEEETAPYIKEHNGEQICFADTLTQATNALMRTGLADATADPDRLNQGHLMLFGVEDWKGAAALKGAFKAPSNTFRRIEVFGCEVGEAEQKILADALVGSNLDNLIQFDLDNTAVTAAGAEAIFKALSPASNIKKLNLQGSIPSTEVLAATVKGLASDGTIFENLHLIDLKINDLKDEAGDEILNLMRLMTGEEDPDGNMTLDLFYNNLGHRSAACISRGLSETGVKITILDLCCNDLTNNGAKEIADALLNNETLRVLKLALNNIGNEGAIAIFGVLNNKSKQFKQSKKFNKTLKVLDLSANVMNEKYEQSDAERAEIDAELARIMPQVEELDAILEDRLFEQDDETLGYIAQRTALYATVDELQTRETRPLIKALVDCILYAYLDEIDFTGIELGDFEWNSLTDGLVLTTDIRNKKVLPKPMTVKFSIVDLMDKGRLDNMEKRIWADGLKEKYSNIDWRRRDAPAPAAPAAP